MKECRRYMDDFPGARADCEWFISKGQKCFDCPNQSKSVQKRLDIQKKKLTFDEWVNTTQKNEFANLDPHWHDTVLQMLMACWIAAQENK